MKWKVHKGRGIMISQLWWYLSSPRRLPSHIIPDGHLVPTGSFPNYYNNNKIRLKKRPVRNGEGTREKAEGMWVIFFIFKKDH